MRRSFGLAVCVVLLASACVHAPLQSGIKAAAPAPMWSDPPAIAREFRGVWVATVGNIDWPSQAGLPVEQQKLELIRIMDTAKRMRLNTIVFQVRTGADAFYSSGIEPWSEYLTGTMGQAPVPFYDPLQFAIDEAHRRGLELHAWFNPFRARYNARRSEPAALHISQTRPDWVKPYGPFLWLDPGDPEVQAYSLGVMLDVVQRYDIDAIHIDDYFYPYQRRDAADRLIPFPDDESWQRYRAAGGRAERADWRRANIDRFVRELYTRVKAIKPTVKVGISPFGIWRPGYPPSVTGLDAYAEIFADARKWLREGWLDYLVPQLYWRIDAPQQSYPVLLDWWIEQNQKGRHVVAGNAVYRVLADAQNWAPREIVEQIRLTRAQPGAAGNVHFSMATFLRNRGGLTDTLALEAYNYDAIAPAAPWLDAIPPTAPIVRVEPHALLGYTLAIEPLGNEAASIWIVRLRFGDTWYTVVVPGAQLRYWPLRGNPLRLADEVVVSGVDRSGNESAFSRPTPR
jgi:uncharacterized lipoprotein YddW (UPF0748 family)